MNGGEAPDLEAKYDKAWMALGPHCRGARRGQVCESDKIDDEILVQVAPAGAPSNLLDLIQYPCGPPRYVG